MKDQPELDLNAYALGEGTAAEREAAAAFLAATPEAREDFERVQFTLAALQTVRDEEMPRRIAFVSDPVFEPSLWQRFWASTPKLTFAGAALLAMAIVAHGFLMRPVAVAPIVAGITQAEVDATVAKAVKTAVETVEAKNEARVQRVVATALAEAEQRHTTDRQMMAVGFKENLEYLRKQMNIMYVANSGLSVGGPKDSQ